MIKKAKYPTLEEIGLSDLKLSLDEHSAFQSGLSLLTRTQIESDGKVYTFDTHPFYSKLRDYSDVDMPDAFT